MSMREYRYPSFEIAERIQQIFFENDLNDKQVADAVKCERKCIMNYRHAEHNPSIKFVRWLCSTYKVDANWLLDLSNNRNLKATITEISTCVADESYNKGFEDGYRKAKAEMEG